MRHALLLCTIAALQAPLLYAETPAPTTELDKLSYSLGVKSAENLQSQSVTVNPVQFTQGFNDKMNNQKLRMNDQQMQDTIMKFQDQHISAMMEKEKQMADDNLKQGEVFLKQNKTKPNIKTTASGLQYEVLVAGTGKSPQAGDKVTVNYRGTLLDGTEFDSTYQNKKPVTLPLDRLILGWQEALKMMKVGAKWKIFVPPQLGYGEQGAGDVIGPNSVLIFEIELVNVEAAS